MGEKEGLVERYRKPQAYDIQTISGEEYRELNLCDLEAAFFFFFF